MKFTQYFLAIRERKDRKNIELSWIKRVVSHPIAEVIQADGRIRRWAKIPEDGETVHNAFFDRSFKEGMTDEH